VKELQAVRHATISQRSVFVFDGLLDPHHLQELVEQIQQASFARTESARPETAAYKHAVAEFDLERVRDLPIYSPTVQAVASSFDGCYLLFRAYCNATSVGDMLFTHTDCRPEQIVVTALWYLCTQWDVEWGGETLFFDETGDAVFATTPRPGRLVLFDGAITHVGRPPTAVCPETRFTFALKFVDQLRRA
jgi:SM-20-related protein